ncbi:MAG: SGNH/GDSL hydrolase family protein [Treponema sp.]|nr:SGNH/GDSL hydrolase family protein [Treponema sp.]
MKKINAIFLFIIMIFSFTSCNSDKKENIEVKETIKEIEVPELGCTKEQYLADIEKSLVSPGNNYRLKKFIEKLEKGETVYVAIIGGSVTEGAGIKDETGKELWQQGYAFQFRDQLAEKFPEANIVFNGAGLSGTPSTLGLIRYENHIVKEMGHKPDLLIIEFAVNDGGEPEFMSATEALVRKVYSEDEDSAVILLYSDAKTYKNSQDTKMIIGSYYRVPQISIQNAVEAPDSGISEDLYFDDYVHPRKPGHKFMADCLMNLFEKVEAAKMNDSYALPEVYKKNMDFSNFNAVFADSKNSNVKISAGGFTAVDNNSQSLKKGGNAFPSNWHHSEDSGNDSFVMEVNCKNLIFVYKVQGNWLPEKFGTAEVYVDGNKIAEYDGSNSEGGAWNNSVQKLIINEAECADHKIEVKMAPGFEDKGFTILAIGYGI